MDNQALSALRTLVKQWRESAETHANYAGNNPSVAHTHAAKGHRLLKCADELDAILAVAAQTPTGQLTRPKSSAEKDRDLAMEQRDCLLAALQAIVTTGDDCPACDRGVLRHPENGHWPTCPFGHAEVVIAAVIRPSTV